MSDTLQMLFDAFLKANDVQYKCKDEIYDISFDKPYASLFGEKLKCTFNEKLAEEKKIVFLGSGSFVLSKIIAQYQDKKNIIALQVHPKEKGIIAVQEKIDELNEKEKDGKSANYKVEPITLPLCFVCASVEINAALQREMKFISVLFHEQIKPIFNNEELIFLEYKKLPSFKFDIKNAIEHSTKIIEKYMHAEIEKKREYHEEFVKREVKLKDEHYQQLMKETSQIVDKALWKIEETRQLALKARSFEKMYERGAEKKKEEKKLRSKEKEADTEKDRLRKELLSEIEQIKNMKFKAQAEFVNVGVIEVEAFTINYSTGKKYVYIPELQVLQEK